ncbi:S-adenosyl-L-methionine-dependent methyltransferase [Irpex rosettiformis]|uniref:S-adenosyl-L-methionine-dependent methyltransferase n=1 Tax=Irpex rosettiformis TaxID=378272 RepID=A0ACB8TVU7_9APHY|nr:S-adenosyl-L-methionine-dependent methyltransferase [Irpex rosettiformis]
MDHHHHHHHHEHHHHDAGKEHSDFAGANEAYFDAGAEKNDVQPEWVKLAHDAVEAILKAYPESFDKDKTQVLDFACGTGLVSRELFPHVNSILGIDISQASVDVYNRHVTEQGISPEKLKAVKTLLKGEDGELDGNKYDVVVCTAAYHHFDDVNDITRILASFIKPGGSLVITDTMPEASIGSAPEMYERVAHVVPHQHGFTEEQTRAIFEKAGLKDVDYRFGADASYEGRKLTFFIARAIKK